MSALEKDPDHWRTDSIQRRNLGTPPVDAMPGSTRFRHITVEQCTFVRQGWGHEESARVAASPIPVRAKPLQPSVSPETRAAIRRTNWPDQSMPLGSLGLVARPSELGVLGQCGDMASTSGTRPRTSPGMPRPRSGPAYAGTAAALGQRTRHALRSRARSPTSRPSTSAASIRSRCSGRSAGSVSSSGFRGTRIEPRITWKPRPRSPFCHWMEQTVWPAYPGGGQ